jgi:hypothetical protein
MNIVFDIGHPAQVHLFKNFLFYLEKNNFQITIFATNKDVVLDLLDYYHLSYIKLPKPDGKFFLSILRLIRRDFYIFWKYFKLKFYVGFGTSISLSHLSIFSKFQSYILNEDDDNNVPLFTWMSYPFSTKIVNPDCIRFKGWKKKRILYNSFHELAYLHPNNFTPDNSILLKYGLKSKEYIILRLNSLQAHHDVNAQGISHDLYIKIKELLKEYVIIESKENSKTHQIKPWDMHNVLAHAKMIISDSQTMTIEAAVLGIPAIRINTFMGISTVIDELELKYGLAYGFNPHQEEQSLSTIKYLATDTNVDKLWQERKEKMLAEKCDLNQWMIDYFENNINKIL